MSTTRPHRFPPLLQLRQGHERVAGLAGAQLQAALADGFQEGMGKGYAEGHASGLAAGQEEARRIAEEQGFQQGWERARADAGERFAGPLAAVEDLQRQLRQLQDDYQNALRREVVDLVERVARQVIRAELTLRPTQLLALVDETLAAMPAVPREQVRVHLHPEDLQRLEELAPERAREWRLQADAQLQPGECRVLAGSREADAGCAQRLDACMRQVREQLHEPAAPALQPEAA
ncbi:flagellar assembly protein FliH [Roseateles sp. BYS78W]|uniref:Flagellar assembly protein FliH n=1 Tax=Pelomonas candidula TaxID=3299025 RepID=A0ABW7HGF4_9BURK